MEWGRARGEGPSGVAAAGKDVEWGGVVSHSAPATRQTPAVATTGPAQEASTVGFWTTMST